MTMRRTLAVLLAIVLAVAVIVPARRIAHRPAHYLTALGRGLGHVAARMSPRCAVAQQTMQFHPVSPESAARIERIRPRRVARITISSDKDTVSEPQGLTLPSPPAMPEPPPPISRSGDLTKIGSDIHIQKDEVVQGDVFAIRGDVIVDGHVEGSVTSMGGDVKLSSTGRVDGDVATIGGELTEEPGSYIGGERVTAGSARARRYSRHAHATSIDIDDETRQAARTMSAFFIFLIVVGVAWAIARFAPARTAAAIETLKREPGMSVGIGGLVFALIIPSIIALALVMALLCITIIGIPLAIAAIIGYAAFFVVFMTCGFTTGVAIVGERLIGHRSLQQVTITRAVVWGATALAGFGLSSRLMRIVGRGTPLHGLGVFLFVLYWVALALVITYGGGAWLRSELATGTLGRWWAKRKRGTPAPMTMPTAGGVVPPPYTGVVTPPYTGVAMPPAAPPPTWTPPPSPPEAFAPPPVTEPPPPPPTEPPQS
jgi:cytoskeletal protein CcmA (bactofilin family)